MGPFCRDGDFRSEIPDLASDRRLDHCGVGEVSADSLHRRSCSWGITPESPSKKRQPAALEDEGGQKQNQNYIGC